MRALLTSVVLLLFFSAKARAPNIRQYSCSSLKTQHRQFDGNLIQALVFLEHENRCPIVAEVTKPFPLSLHIPAGMRSLKDDLESLRLQMAGYSLTEQIGVTSVREVKLQRSPDNPMNQIIRWYYMPDTLTDLKLSLPSAISSAATGLGGLITGVGLAPENNAALKSVILHDIVGHDILVQAFSDIGSGFSLIIFRNDHPVKNSSDTLGDWTLLAGPSVSTFQIRRTDLGMR